MSTQFTRAVLRQPSSNFADGVTTSTEGRPDVARALAQHAAYAQALRDIGLSISILPADEAYPDSTFVEDAAVITARGAVITRPGADSRRGEIAAIGATLSAMYDSLHRIEAPGTLDGGDICETDSVVLIGVTARTNEEGARQLSAILEGMGYASEIVDIRSIDSLLHLKTGISYLGDNRMAIAHDVPLLPAFERFELVRLAPEEGYAANCIRVNDRVIIACGYPKFAAELERLGYHTLALEMSEFRKMDGGLSCLSLRF